MRSRMSIITLMVAMLAALLAACGQTTPVTFTTATNTAPASSSSASGGAKVGSIEIVDAWTRPAMSMMDTSSDPKATSAMTDTNHSSSDMSMGDGPTTGSFMLIRNSGAADRLIKANSDVAKSTELHTVEMVDGVMQMRPVEGGIDVPANGEVALKPGSYHVMLIGVNKELKVGDTVALTLEFEKAGKVTVQTSVRQP